MKSYTLHDLPADERPRERLIKYGVEVLSLQELLTLILGRGTKLYPIMSISQQLLSKFGSLEKLSEASIEDLITIKGLGFAKACQIKACFELGRRLNCLPELVSGSEIPKQVRNDRRVTPENIYQQVRSKIVNYHKEHLLVVSLDNRNGIIGIETVSVGTLNNSLIHPRETFEAAIKRHAAQIILCHNHPSGEISPSDDDILVTENLVKVGKVLGIEVIDHLIITTNNFFSFAKNNLI